MTQIFRPNARAGAVAALAALAIGIAGITIPAFAQQVVPKNATGPKGPQRTTSPKGWTKSCTTADIVKKNEAGKEEARQIRICLTKNEQLDSKSGKVLFSAALRHVEGQDKQFFMVTLPLGMRVQPGVRSVYLPKDVWEKMQKNEKIDDSKLKPVSLVYTACYPVGCDAEVEATAELMGNLKSGGGMMLYAINSEGSPVAFSLPLAGLENALAQQFEETYRAMIVVPKK